MIPIIKNVTVVDENGKQYEPTYLRRAKGLVKNGRARFVADNTICLSRPPGESLEDNQMSENINEAAVKNTQVSLDYIMEKINQIIEDKQYLTDALGALRDFKNNESMNGGIGDEAKATALGTIVESREKTNQRLLAILEKMLDSLI